MREQRNTHRRPRTLTPLLYIDPAPAGRLPTKPNAPSIHDGEAQGGVRARSLISSPRNPWPAPGTAGEAAHALHRTVHAWLRA
jgi:hypothetical protein